MDEVVRDFLLESHENLERLDQAFVALEKDPRDRAKLDAIFRAIHTIKGASGFLGFVKLQALTHSGENYLSRLREGTATLTPESTDCLLELVDAVRTIFAAIEASGGTAEGGGEYGALAARLDAFATGRTVNPVMAGGATKAPVEDPFDAELAATAAMLRARDEATTEAANGVHHGNGNGAPPLPEMPTTRRAPKPEPLEAPLTKRVDADPGQPRPDRGAEAALADTTVRVDVRVLDRLMNLVGELVLTRNRLLQHVAQRADSIEQGLAQTLNHLTAELQDGVMKTRMQPISTLWSKLPRVVRDLARGCGKQVRVEQEGAETELDRTLIEALKDPMTHIVRNAVDHGIESPEARAAAGKPAEGVLRLRACAESGHVVIEVEDDGRGIDPARVKAKAVEKGLITAERAAKLDDREAVELVFLPGFSTAEQVTNLSGRGVGMDVVKSNMARIGGRIELRSTPGHGTTLHMTVPLTLAIVPALLVAGGDGVFALPQTAVLELLRPRRSDPAAFAEIYGRPFLRLRGDLLPLVDLRAALGLPPRDPASEVANVVVLQALGQRFGIAVDAIHATEEIVVKPLGKQFASIHAYAGATILGDGRLALVLEPSGIGRLGHALDDHASELAVAAGDDQASAASEHREALLLFEDAAGGRVAVPVADVMRVEEVPATSIERIGGREVVQYRGAIIPVVRFAEAGGDHVQLVVHERAGRRAGLVVGRVVDAVESGQPIERQLLRRGVKGCVVVQDKVTELIDVDALLAHALAAET